MLIENSLKVSWATQNTLTHGPWAACLRTLI